MNLEKIAIEIRNILENKRNEYGLSFEEDNHIYTMNDLNGRPKIDFPSVSSIIKYFHDEFDSETLSFRKAKGNKKVQNQLLLEWKLSGEYATNIGSRTHFNLEKHLIGLCGNYKDVRQPIFECDETQSFISDNMIKAGKDFIDIMHKRGAVLLDTEIVLGSPYIGYTGQPDKVWLYFDGKELGIIITDWKGLPLDTPILTNNGWKKMESLTINDKVYDKDGNLVNIKNISKIKNKRCLKMKFDNNEEIVSDFEHRWLVYTEQNYKKKEFVLTTQEIKDYLDNLDERKPYKILKIENPKPLNNEKIELPIDPYLLGIWLGDGHSIDNKITQANENVWNEIIKRGYNIGEDLSQGGSGIATTRTVFGIYHLLKDLNLIKNKHIPEIYLLGSFEQRLNLLQGIMDSDGYYNKKRQRFSITSNNEKLVNYYVELISSLGIKPTIIKYNKKLNGKIFKCFNVEFLTTDFNPFLSRNQNIIVENKKNKRSYRIIKSIEEVETVPTKCIEVDSPSNTFLCGRSLLVTHNTNKPKNFEIHHYTNNMYEPFEFLPNNSLGHYNLQLPLYVKLLFDMLKGSKYENIKLFGCIIVLLKDDSTFEEFRIPKSVYNKVLNMNMMEYINNKKKEVK